MATITSDTLSAPSRDRDGRVDHVAGIRAFFSDFLAKAFNPYRPELHYMRGPGPACRAKQAVLSPAVQSMVAEIRAAKMKSPL